jgi:tetratricopeptide (TPR) repeat protein
VAFLAAQYARQKYYPDAILVLKDGIEKIPGSVDLRVILANLQYQTGFRKEAMQQLQAVADQHKTELVHWQRLAQLQLLEKDQDGAIQSLRTAVAANPTSIESITALVTLIGAQKGVPDALAEMQKFVAASPKRAELKIALAQFQESARQPENAEATYRALIASEGLDAQGLVARDRLAAMLVRREDFAAAETLIAEVLKENPRDNDALILRAGIALSRNQAATAITDLRSVLRDQPNSIPLMRTLARAHLQAGDTALAEEALRQALQANPGDSQSRFELASLLTTSGRGNQALPVLEQLIKDSPDNLQAREAYFRLQAAMADIPAARKTAEEIKALRPDQPTGSMLLGTVLEHDKEYQKASAEYENALKLNPDSLDALAALVRVDMAQKQPAKAIARAKAMTAKKPESPIPHELLGELYLAQGNTQAALQAFDMAIAAQPTWWVPYRAKANAQQQAGTLDQAMATLASGAEKSGALEIFGDLASAYERQGKVDQAIATYEAALKRHPRALPIANNLAMLLVSHRKDKASLERASQVAQVLAGNEMPAMLDTLGWVKYRTGEVSEALPLLRKAAEKAPTSAEIHYHLGMAQLQSGDRAGAKSSLESALSGTPKFRGADDARSALASLRGAG